MCGICHASSTYLTDCPYTSASPIDVKTGLQDAGELAFGDGSLDADRNEGLDFGRNDSVLTGESMNVGDTFSGFLNINDLDMVRISLEVGATYEFELNPTETTVDFPVLAVFNQFSEIVAIDDNLFDGVANLVFTAGPFSTNFLAIVSLETLIPIGVLDIGGYEFTINEVDAPAPIVIEGLDEVADLAGNDTTDGTIEVGGTFKGLHDANDTDWIAVELTEGQTVTIDVNGFSTTPVRDTILTIFDENSQSIASNDDFGFSLFSEVTITASYTGTHYIQVETFNQASDVGGYQVRVFEGDVAPNGGGQDVLTADEIAAYLTTGFWEDDVFTTGGPFAFDIEAGGTITVDLDALAADGRFLAEAALAAWTTATGIQFQTVSSGAMITFDDNEEGAFSFFEELNGNTIVESIVNVSTTWLDDFGTTLDSYSFQTYIHEVGHALGLGHAGNYNGFARFGVDNHYANDSWQSSVMSYFSQTDNTTVDADEAFILTPMMADLLAIETLYGLSDDRRTGDTTYGEGSTAGDHYDDLVGLAETIAFTVVDDGGIDTINFSTATDDQRVTLVAEGISDVGGVRGAMTIARGTEIENFVSGSGNDHITGNNTANVLEGGAGADTLIGGDGEDTLTGGEGADNFIFQRDDQPDTVTDYEAGIDRFDMWDNFAGVGNVTVHSEGFTIRRSGGYVDHEIGSLSLEITQDGDDLAFHATYVGTDGVQNDDELVLTLTGQNLEEFWTA